MFNLVRRAETSKNKGSMAPEGKKGLTAAVCAAILNMATGCMENITHKGEENCPTGYTEQLFSIGPKVYNNIPDGVTVVKITEPKIAEAYSRFIGPYKIGLGEVVCIHENQVDEIGEKNQCAATNGEELFFDPNCNGKSIDLLNRSIDGEVFAPEGFKAQLVLIKELLLNRVIVPLKLPNRSAFLYPKVPVAVFPDDPNPFAGTFEEYISENGVAGYIQTTHSSDN